MATTKTVSRISMNDEMITIHRSNGGEPVSISIDALASLAQWWSEREKDLRMMLFNRFPVPLQVAMHPSEDGRYMVGRTEDLRLVKMAKERYDAVIQEQADQVRHIYLAQQSAPVHDRWDSIDAHFGISHHAKDETWDLEMMATDRVNQHILGLMHNPGWFALRDDNLDRGKVAPVP